MIVPIALTDLWIIVYQRICSPICGIARVRHATYMVVDRHHLAYLNGIEKLNCVDCGYANEVGGYVQGLRGGPSGIGARSAMRRASRRHTGSTIISWITAMPTGTSGGCCLSAPN